MNSDLLKLQQFQKYEGKPLRQLINDITKHYPFAYHTFDGAGGVYFITGLWCGKEPIKIYTGLKICSNDDRLTQV